MKDLDLYFKLVRERASKKYAKLDFTHLKRDALRKPVVQMKNLKGRDQKQTRLATQKLLGIKM